MKLSIKDIAKSLNLSKATVSWILSGQGEKKGFSAATIKRVKDYADSVGYRPNQLARSLSLGKTCTIGLIVPSLGDPFYAQLAEAVEEAASVKNYSLMVCNSRGDGQREAELIDKLNAMQIDGIIMAPNKFTETGVENMLASHYPFVLVDRYYPHLKTNYVIVNNRQASHDVVVAMGKKSPLTKLAMVTTDTHLYVMNHRMEGYKDGLAELGIPFNPSLVVEVDRQNYKEDILVKLQNLFDSHSDIDGLFFSTHYLAMEAVHFFMEQGIDYRHCLNLGCFHEIEGLDILAPEMLVSRIPIKQMGKEAIRILLDRIEDKEKEDFECVILDNIFKEEE